MLTEHALYKRMVAIIPQRCAVRNVAEFALHPDTCVSARRKRRPAKKTLPAYNAQASSRLLPAETLVIINQCTGKANVFAPSH
jgi:hypothetical protein